MSGLCGVRIRGNSRGRCDAPDRDLLKLVHCIGPQFAEGAAKRDERDIFVAEHYEVLKERRVFSALIPMELRGGECVIARCASSCGNSPITAHRPR